MPTGVARFARAPYRPSFSKRIGASLWRTRNSTRPCGSDLWIAPLLRATGAMPPVEVSWDLPPPGGAVPLRGHAAKALECRDKF